MIHIAAVAVLLLSLGDPSAVTPFETRIPVEGSEIVVTSWNGGSGPQAVVLLVPGWGGGPSDQLGIAESLSAHGVAVAVLSPRGWHSSTGNATFANALDDIEAALDWVRATHGSNVILGGHSWGGGMALAYVASDSSVHRVFSIAGTDHGQFIRQYMDDPQYAAVLEKVLASTAAPDGPIRFDVKATLEELRAGQDTYGLVENAGKLSDRSILIVGGWEDTNVTIDDSLLPLYRALRTAGASDVIFLTYHAHHSFSSVREEMHSDLLGWVLRPEPASLESERK